MTISVGDRGEYSRMKEIRSTQDSITRTFAKFILGTNYKDLPTEVVYQCKRAILDFCSVAMVGYREGAITKPLIRYILNIGGKEEASIIGDGNKVPCTNAALANAAMGHALDLDDGHRYAHSHIGVVVIPTSLAIAELTGASIEDLLTAITLGYDVFARIGRATNPSQSFRGFHPSGICGTYGAATAAAKLLKLNENETVNALGIAGTQGAGLLEVIRNGQMIKPLQPARAAQSGIFAARLAKMGLVGPETILEGDKGFLNATADEIDFTVIQSELGERYEILNSYIKLYPNCRHTHAAIDLVLSMRNKHELKPTDVECILVRTYRIGKSETGEIFKPDSPQAALFSMPYALALALIEGKVGIDQFTEDKISDERILNQAKRVRIELDPKFEEIYPEARGAEVTITLKNGSEITEQKKLAKGEPEDPATDEELTEKFMKCSKGILSVPRARQIIDLIYNIEGLSSIKELLILLKSETV